MDILIGFLRRLCILVSSENFMLFCVNYEFVWNSHWPCILHEIIILLYYLLLALIL